MSVHAVINGSDTHYMPGDEVEIALDGSSVIRVYLYQKKYTYTIMEGDTVVKSYSLFKGDLRQADR